MPRKKQHYVDNSKLLEVMSEYREQYLIAKDNDIEPPVIPDYAGECFLKIANGLSFRPNFINYTYRDEMISDGIENCLQYVYNFDPNKSNNPFAYFTQIIYFAFIRRIQKEKKQTHIKHKIIEKEEYRTHDTLAMDSTNYSIHGFDPTIMLPDEPVYKTKEKEKSQQPSGLEEFMED